MTTTNPTITSLDARTRQPFGNPVPASTAAQVDAAAQAAADAFSSYGNSPGATRAALLRGLATALEAERESLVPLADQESGLGPVRLNGELDRTAFQLRRFADIAERGEPFRFTDDPAVAGGPPVGHPALARVQVPLGPVAMFAASNFPFAFSVLGGDTASALAAGCPVVVKVHSAHVQLSARTVALAQRVVAEQGLPAGVFGAVFDAGFERGVQLLQHPAIAAGAFTGSTRGGAALQAAAQQRPRPIPFYGELGSVNPIVALPAAIQANGAALATTLAGSIVMGCGQFCTSPGVLVLVDDGEAAQTANTAFIEALAAGLRATQPHSMLTPGMRSAFEGGVAHWRAAVGLQFVVDEAGNDAAPRAVLAQTTLAAFSANAGLREEVFGPAALLLRVASVAEAVAVLNAVQGSLTVTLWGAEQDTPDTRALLRAASQVAGRVLFAGVPTGVAVSAGQQHGGPWPSSTAPFSTSVGDAALQRFLRPVALQDAPAWVVGRQGQPV